MQSGLRARWRGVWGIGAAAALVLLATPFTNAASPSTATPGISIAVTPKAGPPGTTVTLSGYIPAAAHGTPQQFGDINFGGFPDGLDISAGNITWSKTNPGHFVTRFTVPTVPWLSPKGEVDLKVGGYPVGIQCFGVVAEGCATRADEASTTFQLTGPIAVPAKAPTLTVTPAAARPGETVRISGWAPLTNIIGIPFGYSLVYRSGGRSTGWEEIGGVAQALNGDLSGTVEIPASAYPFGWMTASTGHLALQYVFTALSGNKGGAKHEVEATLDPAPFQVLASPTWGATLAGHSVSGLTTNQNRGYFQGLTAGSGRIYTASDGALWERAAAGGPWTQVPTATLPRALATAGFKLFGQSNLTGITTAPGYAQSLFASVASELPKEGAPPIFGAAAHTMDGGQAWALVPPPRGLTAEDFGGFQVDGRAVLAWWRSSRTIVATATTDGGRSWQTLKPSCPAVGSCVLLGPVPAANFGEMSNESESLVTVRDHAWVVVGQTVVNEGAVSSAARLSPRETVWVGNPSYPVEVTRNGGQTWTYVTTPPLPDQGSDPQLVVPRLLPTGTLLAQDPANSRYYELNRGAGAWRPVPKALTLSGAVTLAVVGNFVYWETLSDTATGPTSPKAPAQFLAVPAQRY